MYVTRGSCDLESHGLRCYHSLSVPVHLSYLFLSTLKSRAIGESAERMVIDKMLNVLPGPSLFYSVLTGHDLLDSHILSSMHFQSHHTKPKSHFASLKSI